MSPAEVSSISKAFMQPSVQTQTVTAPERDVASPSVNTAPAGEKQKSAVDTVSIMAAENSAKSESRTESAKKESAPKPKKLETTSRVVGEVEFAYNFKGDLRVRFMDRGNHLIYQIPPELIARVTDNISQPNSSVNTKA